VSIDRRPSLDIVPFGVSCAASDEQVEVSLSGADSVEGQLYVLDAVTGDLTEVYDGKSLTVQPNDYGRYFLTTRSDLTAINEASTTKGIVVSVRGHEVTVKAGEPLNFVRSVTLGGETVSAISPVANEATMMLNSGVYLIEAQTASAKKTMKIIVK